MCASKGLVRFLNVIVFLLGAISLALGVQMILSGKGIDAPSSILLGTGGTTALLGMIMICAGYKSDFFLRLYSLFFFLACGTEVILASVILFSDGFEEKIKKWTDSDDVTNWITGHMPIIYAIVFGVIGVKVAILIFVVSYAYLKEDEFDDEYSVRRRLLDERHEELLDLEEQIMEAAAVNRYREKNADMYKKYGIK